MLLLSSENVPTFIDLHQIKIASAFDFSRSLGSRKKHVKSELQPSTKLKPTLDLVPK